MSFIRNLNNNLENIDVYLNKYQKFINDNKIFFSLEGQNLEGVCKRLPFLIAEFKLIASELKSMNDFLEFRKETTEGELWKKYLENSKRHLAAKDIQMYSKAEPDLIMIGEFILEVAHMKQNISAILDALDVLHWQLNNMVKLRIASLEEVVL